MRGGNNPHINMCTGITADPRHNAILQHTQKLHLHIEAHVANFIKEERACVSLFKSANSPCIGPCESTAFMTEQFGFNEFAGDCPAIEGDEWLGRSRAFSMDRPGDHFLA